MESPWRSVDGENNALQLRVEFHEGFRAIAEYDRIGHLLLHHAGGVPASTVEAIVGLAMLRRAVTLFTGIRTLLEHSLPDVARAPARAYFELWLQHRCLAYGSANPVFLETPTTSSEREPRAHRYHVAAERWAIRTRAIMFLESGTVGGEVKKEDAERLLALEREAYTEIARLRREFPEEWDYFGDVTDPRALIKRVDRGWFAAEFPASEVTSLRHLARAFDHLGEYDLLYDAFSALMHSRGTGHDVTIEGGAASIHHPFSTLWFQTIAWFALGWHQLFLMTAAKWHYPAMIPQLQALFSREKTAVKSLAPESFPPLLA